MRSLLIISIAVVLFGGYIEWTAQQSRQQQAIATQHAVGVIQGRITRQPAKTDVVETVKPTVKKPTIAKVETKKRPLNLTIPLHHEPLSLTFPEQRQKLQWQKKSAQNKEISYNAELVFDAKEGSSITGGKVNIRIPFG